MRRARAATVVVALISLVGCSDVASTAEPTASAQPSPTVSAQPTASPETPTLPLASPTPFETAASNASPVSAPSPTATAVPTATPTQYVSHEGLVVDWNGSVDAGFGPVYRFTGVAERAGTYVAVGQATWDMQAGIWFSHDGLHWAWASFPYSGTEMVELQSVAADEDTFVAVGSRRRFVSDGGYVGDGAVFVSSDGPTWELVESDLFSTDTLNDVLSLNSAFVAISWEDIYTSPDGRTWVHSTDASAIAVGQGLEKVISDGATLWAFSRSDTANEHDATVEVWTSGDGATWTLAGKLPGSRGSGVDAAAVGPKGAIALGSDLQVWYSPDGSAWQQASQPPSDIWRGDVLADQTGFVATGRYILGSGCAYSEEDVVGVTWTSVDGSVWRQMPEKGFKGKVVQALSLAGRTLIGLGVDYNKLVDGEDDAMIWASELPDVALDPNPPISPPTHPAGAGCG